ncbi:MAG: SPOR domain-containing protein [Lysobacterales bacterium]
MDKALKQRLVGASVLIILAVIVLPMLLSGRSDRLKQESRQIELPPKPDELSIETRRFPVGISTRPASATAQESEDAMDPANREQAQTGNDDLAPVGDDAPGPAPEPGSGDGETPAGTTVPQDVESAGSDTTVSQELAENIEKAPEVTSITLESDKPKNLDISEAADGSANAPRYLVQVASFSNEKNANALADLLKAEKLPVLLDVVDRPAGRMYRVRVGPYAKRAEADKLVSGLSTKMTELTPRVLDLRPDDSAPVSTPSDPLVRWVVQVGSFSHAKSAEDLVAKLRLTGLDAFSEKVTSATGAVYKVRIGPELDRDTATDLAHRVKNEQGLDAFVTTQE